MSTLPAQMYLTPEEYLTWERKQPFKNEYHEGHIITMSGASRAHNLITMNVANQFYNQLVDRECEVYASEMRVRPGLSQAAYYYPDVVVVCDEPRFEDDTFDTLLNPILVVEVLSRSTAAYDRGEKFEHYKQIASLQEYILISQDSVRVEHYRREGQWIHDTFQHLEDILPVASIECEVPLHAIYRRVTHA